MFHLTLTHADTQFFILSSPTVKTTQHFLDCCLLAYMGVILDSLIWAYWVVFVQGWPPAFIFVDGHNRFIARPRHRSMGGGVKAGRRAFVTVPYNIQVGWRCVWTCVEILCLHAYMQSAYPQCSRPACMRTICVSCVHFKESIIPTSTLFWYRHSPSKCLCMPLNHIHSLLSSSSWEQRNLTNKLQVDI